MICDIKGNLLPRSSMLETTCKNERQLFCFDRIESSNLGQSNVFDDENKNPLFFYKYLQVDYKNCNNYKYISNTVKY
jgi:hypothetical protein